MEMRPTIDLDAMAIAVRLGAAVLAGAVIGLDRELKRKPAGLRTHALVCLGSAIVVLATAAAAEGGGDAISRAVQGVITGIGFLGAGVIMQYTAEHRVEGLTTAASVWVAAGMGIACGAGLVEIVLISLVLIIAILVGGDRIEKALERRDRPPE